MEFEHRICRICLRKHPATQSLIFLNKGLGVCWPIIYITKNDFLIEVYHGIFICSVGIT